MFLAYQYRLYPYRPQETELALWLRELVFLWNYSLDQRRFAWERDHRRVTYLDQQRDLTRWRNFDSGGLGRLPVSVAQDSLQRLDLAFRAFFRRVRAGETPGYPHFRRSVSSFSFVPRSELWTNGPNGTWRLTVPRLGMIPVRRHRPPPEGGTVQSVTVRREADGWYVSLVYAVPDPPPPPPGLPTHPVGIDVGLAHLATLSTGTTVEPPRFFRRAEAKLALEQRRLSRKRRGSHRWERQRERVARCHARVARQRRGLAHQLSHDWTEEFDLLAMEELEVGSLGRSRLAKPIHDAGWAMLRGRVEYKARLKSRRFVAVDPRGTSRSCSTCGEESARPMALEERVFECPRGHRIDRDVNAAQNILARGWSEVVGRKPAEGTRGERGPLRSGGGRRVYQRRQVRSRSREFAAGARGREGTREGPPDSIGPER